MKKLFIILILTFMISCSNKDKGKQINTSENIKDKKCFYTSDSSKVQQFIDSFIIAAKKHDTLFLVQHIDFPLAYGAALQVGESKIKLNDESYISKEEFIEQIELIAKSQFISKLEQSRLNFPDDYSNKSKDCYLGFMMQYQIHSEAAILWSFERKQGAIKLVRYDIAG